MRIGFIGLGHMGLPMAENLAAAGHQVVGFDLSEGAMAAASKAGIERAATLSEAVSDAGAVITMLTTGDIVRQVYAGEGGIMSAAPKDAILIDCSTIDVASARAVSEAAAGAGLQAVDAPVSGGVAGAKAATLAFMVGGSELAFARASDVLVPMAGKIVHAGGPGSGQAAKLCNNMLLAICMIGTSEAFQLARSLGLEDQTFFDIAANASGQNWALSSYCPVPGPVPASPANRAYKPGFSAALMLKDLGLAMHAAAGGEAALPLGSKAFALYQQMVEGGGGELDFSAIINALPASAVHGTP